MKTTNMLTRRQWITRYGGQERLDAEQMTVVPCIDCGDSVCHGWKVVNTSTLALAVEDTMRQFGFSVSVVDPGRDDVKTAYVGEYLDTIMKFESERGLIDLIETIQTGGKAT
jgi:hypothetical protein